MFLLAEETSECGEPHASRFLLFDAKFLTTEDTEDTGAYEREDSSVTPVTSVVRSFSFDRQCAQKASRQHQHAPGSVVSEDAADFALKCGRTASELGAEFAGKGSQTSVADLEAHFRHAAFGSKHLPGAVHAQASEKIMRGLAESGAEKAMEMKFRKTGFARRLLQPNTGLIFGGEQVSSATEPAEGVVME